MKILSGQEVGSFVRKTVRGIGDFDGNEVSCVKEVVKKAIENFELNASFHLVNDEYGEMEVLCVNSEAAYLNLNKIVTYAIGDGDRATVDYIYEGELECTF